jgi:hypothetical protein
LGIGFSRKDGISGWDGISGGGGGSGRGQSCREGWRCRKEIGGLEGDRKEIGEDDWIGLGMG